MQKILFLKSTGDGPVDRLINIDNISTAYPNPEGEGTICIVGSAQIKMGMAFADFVAKVEWLISENYRVSNETSIEWYNKRMKDTEEMMRNAMKDLHT